MLIHHIHLFHAACARMPNSGATHTWTSSTATADKFSKQKQKHDDANSGYSLDQSLKNTPSNRQQQSKITRWHHTPRSKLITVIKNGGGDIADNRMTHAIFISYSVNCVYVMSHFRAATQCSVIVRCSMRLWIFHICCSSSSCFCFLADAISQFLTFFSRPGFIYLLLVLNLGCVPVSWPIFCNAAHRIKVSKMNRSNETESERSDKLKQK